MINGKVVQVCGMHITFYLKFCCRSVQILFLLLPFTNIVDFLFLLMMLLYKPINFFFLKFYYPDFLQITLIVIHEDFIYMTSDIVGKVLSEPTKS